MLADAVVVLHLAFIVFVVLGGLVVLKWPKAAFLHLPAAAWGALVEFFGWYCPLTPLEIRLRYEAYESGYSGGFIEHYLLPLIYPEGLTREIQLILGGLVVVVNVTVYLFVLLRFRGKSKIS